MATKEWKDLHNVKKYFEQNGILQCSTNLISRDISGISRQHLTNICLEMKVEHGY